MIGHVFTPINYFFSVASLNRACKINIFHFYLLYCFDHNQLSSLTTLLANQFIGILFQNQWSYRIIDSLKNIYTNNKNKTCYKHRNPFFLALAFFNHSPIFHYLHILSLISLKQYGQQKSNNLNHFFLLS